MFEFYYDFIDFYLQCEDFEIFGIDTGSNSLGTTPENLENLIKPELKEHFEHEKHNWFIIPLAPQ